MSIHEQLARLFEMDLKVGYMRYVDDSGCSISCSYDDDSAIRDDDDATWDDDDSADDDSAR